ncbi:MAG: hypothetical protein IPF68_13145 [Bacteroidales bacterium]|nr:hypothetical protein [Bacteroidales bacterium]
MYNSENPYTILKGHGLGVTSIEFSPDGKFLGSGSKDYKFFIWDYYNSRRLDLNFGIGVNHQGPVNFISFIEKGRIYTCSSDMTIKLWTWGFPILEVNNFRLADKNKNGKIEGTEEVEIKFDIENKGDGSAIRLKFNINDVRKTEGLTFPNEFFVNEIPAKGRHTVSIPVMTSSKLRNAIAKFVFSDFNVICNSPFPLKDTSYLIETIATPLLQIDSIYFTKSDTSHVLTGNETGIIKIHLRNNGVGMANRVKVSVSCDKPDAGVLYDKQIDFGNLSTNSSLALPIPVTGTQKIEDGLIRFRFEITDEANISVVSSTYQLATKKYEPTLIEEIRQIVEQKISVWQKKGKWEKTEEYKERVTEVTRNNQITLFTNQTIDSLVKVNLKWALATNNYDPDNESFEISIPKFDPIYLKMSRRST